MSLLQQDSSAPDDAARGEDYTKGTSHVVVASVIAAIVVSIAIAAYFIAGQKPPAATGEITRAVAHSIHHESADTDAAGNPMPKMEFDQLLIFAHVKLHNQSKNPLFLHMITANVTLPNEIHTSYAAVPTDYERLFKAHPDLASLHGHSLKTEETIQPGEWLEGDFVSSFEIPKAEWEARKNLNFSFSFRYEPDLVLTPKMVVEQ